MRFAKTLGLRFLLSALFLGLFPLASPAQKAPVYRKVSISNVEPRRDTTGAIVDAHDGNLLFAGNRYYLYGTAYGNTAGYSINNRFRVYSSPDLVHWTFEGEVLKAPPDGVYYNPSVVYNAHTKKYIIWYNWYPRLWDGYVGVAESDTPIGPFTIVNTRVELMQADKRPGAGTVFVDDDGAAYYIYSTIADHHAVRVEKLDADYTGSARETSDVLATECEATSMLKHDGKYYALFDRACCFCPGGSGARVYVASSPLGPYTLIENINRDAQQKPIVAAQQASIARIPTPDGTALIWIGDRWGSRPDGVKGHDFQFWSAPLRFDADGKIAPIENLPQWSLTIRVGRGKAPHDSSPYMWPKKKDPNPLKTDPCTGKPLAPEE
jgi:Glycosyl hydrolases family 43